jgi:hypothetical protein
MTVVLLQPPPVVGGFRLGNVTFLYWTKKPSMWNRFWMRALLGLAWVDA